MCCCVDNLGMCLQVPGYRVMVKHLELLLHSGSAEDFWEHRDHLQRSNEQDNILAVLFPCVIPPTGLPRWLSDKESDCQCRRHKRWGFDPWVGKIPWRRKCQPASVFLPRKFHGQRSLVGYSPKWGQRESDTNERLSSQHTLTRVTWELNSWSVFWKLGLNFGTQ